MISLSGAVNLVLLLVVGALIFGLLWYLLVFVGGKIPGGAGQWFVTVGQVVLVILAVLVLIGVLLSLVGGQPLFRP